VERHILDWLVHYGAIVLFLAQMFGIFGVPIPDELLMTVAGALVRRGELGAAPTALAAVGGCIVGITFSYVLGRTVGVATLRRVFHLRDETLARAQRWFQRFGRWLLTFAYYIPGVRHVTAIAAGSVPLPYSTFALFAYSGAVVWCATFLGVGYVAGDRWREALAAAQHHAVIVGASLVAALIALMLWSMTRRAHA